MTGWQKIELEQANFPTVYKRMAERLDTVIFSDPLRYADVAIFTPNLAHREKYDRPLTTTMVFSPDFVRYFSDLLAPFAPQPCARPSRSEVEATYSPGLNDLSHLWS